MSASSAAPAGAPARPQPLYFINGPADFLLVGGLSILAFAVLYFTGGEAHQGRSGAIITLGQQLLWVCNWPHFAATSYRLYHSRDNIRQYPLTALGIPWLILAVMIGSVVYPDTIAPYFVMGYLLWSPYHFSGQTVGVSMIYARRAGFFVGKAERFALSSFVFATFLSQTIQSHVIHTPDSPRTMDYFEIKFPVLGLPQWAELVTEVWMYLTGLLFVLLVLRWCIRNRRMLPPIVVLPALAQYVWFIFGPLRPSFNEFVPFFHSMQYLLIAWSMQLKEKLDREQARPPARPGPLEQNLRIAAKVMFAIALYPLLKWLLTMDAQVPKDIAAYLPMAITGVYIAYIGFSIAMDSHETRPSYSYVIYESLRWFDLNIMIGACLFFVSPILLSHFFGVNKLLAIGITAAGVQVHHFFVDGVIWKLKRATVASPLMVNISDLITPAAQAVPMFVGAPAGVMAAPAEKT